MLLPSEGADVYADAMEEKPRHYPQAEMPGPHFMDILHDLVGIIAAIQQGR